MLYIYGTIFNNATTVLKSLQSISYLPYKKIFIPDNYSTDGTYEILCKYKEKYRLEIILVKCNRGMGRQISMEIAMKNAKNSDYLMTVDFDTIYDADLAILVNNIIIREYKNCVFNNYLCLKEYNSRIPWKDLNNGEDLERYADFACSGFYLLIKKIQYPNEPFKKSRDRRYAHGLKYYIRAFKYKIDLQRSWCFKSFSEFYSQFQN